MNRYFSKKGILTILVLLLILFVLFNKTLNTIFFYLSWINAALPLIIILLVIVFLSKTTVVALKTQPQFETKNKSSFFKIGIPGILLLIALVITFIVIVTNSLSETGMWFLAIFIWPILLIIVTVSAVHQKKVRENESKLR